MNKCNEGSAIGSDKIFFVPRLLVDKGFMDS